MAAKANYSKKPENKKMVTEKKEVVKTEAKPGRDKTGNCICRDISSQDNKGRSKESNKIRSKTRTKTWCKAWTETRSKTWTKTGIGAHDRNDSAVW